MISNYGLFCTGRAAGLFWFRVLGLGLYLLDTRVCDPPFSVRYGYKRSLFIGPFMVTVLNGKM